MCWSILKSTRWALPVVRTLEEDPGVSWGRVSSCSDWTVTSNYASGQLDSLFCHRSVRRKGQVQWQPSYGTFHHDLVGMAIGILGDTSIGSHHAAMIDLFGSMRSIELSQFAFIAVLCCSDRPRGWQVLHTVLPLCPRLLHRCVCGNLWLLTSLRNFESVHPGR